MSVWSVIVNTMQFAFLPAYMRGCPLNVFQTRPFDHSIKVVIWMLIVQIVIIALQQTDLERVIRCVPSRAMRKRLRKLFKKWMPSGNQVERVARHRYFKAYQS